MPTEAPSPVAQRAPFALHRIVVPIDFSEPATNALHTACGLAEKFGAELILLHVVVLPRQAEYVAAGQDFAMFGVDYGEMEAKARLESEDRLDAILTEVRTQGIKAERIIRSGDAAHEILQVAADEHADAIVIATHGYSGLARFLMGSTTERVIRHASCAVFVVRLKGAKPA